MPRKALGDRPLTAAERQARQRKRNADQLEIMRAALTLVIASPTLRQARLVAAAGLDPTGQAGRAWLNQ